MHIDKSSYRFLMLSSDYSLLLTRRSNFIESLTKVKYNPGFNIFNRMRNHLVCFIINDHTFLKSFVGYTYFYIFFIKHI